MEREGLFFPSDALLWLPDPLLRFPNTKPITLLTAADGPPLIRKDEERKMDVDVEELLVMGMVCERMASALGK